MSESNEPAAEDPPRSSRKHRPAHSSEPVARSARRILDRWAVPAAVLIAVVALGVAVWALVRPEFHGPTEQQIADAKKRACNAFNTVGTAVSLNTRADLGTDRVALEAKAANARLAAAEGADYLLSHLDAATPPQLADVMRSLAADLQDITIYALAGMGDTDPGQVARLHDIEGKTARITEQCK
jgi:hypothetical protein